MQIWGAAYNFYVDSYSLSLLVACGGDYQARNIIREESTTSFSAAGTRKSVLCNVFFLIFFSFWSLEAT